MTPILEISLMVCEVFLTIAIIMAFFRLVIGPTVVDRIIAFDLIALTVVAFTALLSVQENTPHFIELLLIISLVGFFGTVVLVRIFDIGKEKRHDN